MPAMLIPKMPIIPPASGTPSEDIFPCGKARAPIDITPNIPVVAIKADGTLKGSMAVAIPRMGAIDIPDIKAPAPNNPVRKPAECD